MLATLLLAGCATHPRTDDAILSPRSDVFAVVLGSGQDGGLPQLGCFEPCCQAARLDPTKRRLASSVMIVDTRTRKRWLLDCTPHIEEQVARARVHAPAPVPAEPPESGRPPLFDGIFLTHAHLGHYGGLPQLGREAYGAKGQRVWATERMERFLVGNDPFAYTVASGGFVLERLTPGEVIELGPQLSIEAMLVPHRDEFSDTVAFVVRGPDRALLYLPDIDKWERWERRVEDVIAEVDVALLDATFYADGEIPGRAMEEIPHPFIAESLRRFAPLPAEEKAKVWFTHLNHSNPAARVGSDAARRVERSGMRVAMDGDVIGL